MSVNIGRRPPASRVLAGGAPATSWTWAAGPGSSAADAVSPAGPLAGNAAAIALARDLNYA
ncbi:MAG: hypothetical protein ACLP8X_37775 [Streptosporangiaceae bacterium]